MIINPYRFGGGGGGGDNPPWANVVSLLHFDGSNGSTTFTDQTGKTWTGSGNAQIDTSVVKFGTGSLKLDGSGDFITCGESASAFNFLHNGSAFTIRGWINLASAVAAQIIFDTGGVTSAARGFYVGRTAGNAIICDIARSTSGFYAARLNSGDGAFANNAWAFVSVCHDPLAVSGNRLRLHVDGIKLDATDIDSPSASNATSQATYGRYVGGNSLFLNGHIDDWQIVNGVALYDVNYTPPTSAFPNS